MNFLFKYISFLNIMDAFLTTYGIEKSFIEEGNPLMEKLYGVNPSLFLLTKLSLSGFLMIFVLLRKVPHSKFVKGITAIAAVIYSGIFLIHCFWLVLILI